ncbi:MAG: PspC domain-containing protein [Chloroflexota bacterium]
MESTTRKLYRSHSDRKLWGVCSGIAEYFGVDPTWVRLAFVLMALAGGPGIVFYVILALIMPEEAF